MPEVCGCRGQLFVIWSASWMCSATACETASCLTYSTLTNFKLFKRLLRKVDWVLKAETPEPPTLGAKLTLPSLFNRSGPGPWPGPACCRQLATCRHTLSVLSKARGGLWAQHLRAITLVRDSGPGAGGEDQCLALDSWEVTRLPAAGRLFRSAAAALVLRPWFRNTYQVRLAVLSTASLAAAKPSNGSSRPPLSRGRAQPTGPVASGAASTAAPPDWELAAGRKPERPPTWVLVGSHVGSCGARPSLPTHFVECPAYCHRVHVLMLKRFKILRLKFISRCQHTTHAMILIRSLWIQSSYNNSP